MGKNDSLLDVMNAVSGHLDKVIAAPRPVMDEMDAFIALDPLLASLHKQYLDAKAQRIAAEKEFGAGDGMTDIAVIAEDSAWCAMQTRYMEVRRDRALMMQAQKMMECARLEEEQREQEKERERSLDMLEKMRYYAILRDTSHKSYADVWLAVLVLLEWNKIPSLPPHYAAAQHFNRLAA